MNDHISVINDMLQKEKGSLDATVIKAEVVIINLMVDFHGFYLLN